MSTSKLAPEVVDGLGGAFRGSLLRPGDAGFDEARMVWNGEFDRTPLLIARCTSAEDVVAAVNFARENDLTLAVRGGGHSAGGYGTCDDGIVIDLSPMNAIEIDPEQRIARAQGGMTWAQFDVATQEHGLALTGGRFSTTGIAGLTLGSGSGWLERRCGLTADNLLSAEMVLADGSQVTASADENPDLFWGIRGGGGNFGIVTQFTYRLHEIGPLIYGGMLIALPERAGEILRWFAAHMASAPRDLGAAIAFISAPPEEFVPPEMHFAPVVGIVVCWAGDHEQGERAVAPIREVAQPVMDLVGPMPYTALQTMLDGGGQHGTRAYMKAEFMNELTEPAIDAFVRAGASRPGPLVQLLLEPLGGAIADMGEDDSALGRRDVGWCYHALSMWMEPGEEVRAAHVAWARELAAEAAPHTTRGVYLNFTSDGDDERVRQTFGPQKYARLVALKDRYDPQNLFRLNGNIRPSREAASA